MKTAVWWLAAALLFSGLLGRLAHVNAELDAERAAHAVTAQDRDRWKATAEAYRGEAVAQAENARRGDGRGVTRQAQAENARLCLDRESNAARDAAERAAIVKQARPRARSAEEKNKVVDDETRRRAVERLNRPL